MSSLLKKALLAAIIGSGLNLVVWYVANHFVLPEPILIRPGAPGTSIVPLSILPIVGFSSVPAFLTAGFLFALRKITRHHMPIFWALSFLILLASFYAPHSLPTPLSQKFALDIMHVIAATTIVTILSTGSRKNRNGNATGIPRQDVPANHQ